MKNRYLEELRNAGNDLDLQVSKSTTQGPKQKNVLNTDKMQYKAEVFNIISR